MSKLLASLKSFDIEKAAISLWVFKKPTTPGQLPSFKGRWVEISAALEGALRGAVAAERSRIEEVQEYSLLAQNNEGSALTITAEETRVGLAIETTAAEVPTKKIIKIKELQNSIFYVVKFIADDKILYAFRKANSSWKARKALTSIGAFFSDNILTVEESQTFELSKHVDFFVIEDSVVIRNKANFESILNYKQAHQDDFSDLQIEPTFADLFSDLNELTKFVGDNKIQLRRASAIRQKGHYKDPTFMANLRARHKEYGLNLVFESNGKIVPTAETCRDIFTALLDHRLASGFSANIYDVPDATRVTLGN